jgi:hypothetical protein
MNPILNPFEELLVGLVRSKIEFITVGGMACAMNGYLRATEDVDILIKRTPANIKNLIQFLSTYGQGFGSQLQESDFADEEGAIRLIEEFPIDIFVVMGGKHYEELKPFQENVAIEQTEIPFLNTDGLILLKKNSVRQKDKIDVVNLLSLKSEK